MKAPNSRLIPGSKDESSGQESGGRSWSGKRIRVECQSQVQVTGTGDGGRAREGQQEKQGTGGLGSCIGFQQVIVTVTNTGQ